MAERFEDRARKFRDFVEKKNAEVSKRDFAGLGFGAATDNRDGGGGVVRGAERAGGYDGVGLAGEGVNLRDGDLFFRGRGR